MVGSGSPIVDPRFYLRRVDDKESPTSGRSVANVLFPSFLGAPRLFRVFAVVLSAIARRQTAYLALTSLSSGNPEPSVQVTNSVSPKKTGR
jgi:hypothetical protein